MNGLYRIKFLREILFPVGKIPISPDNFIITTPCSIYTYKNRIYITINVQDSMTLRYELYIGNIDLNKDIEHYGLNRFTREYLDKIAAVLPTKSERNKTKACCFV